MGGTKVGLAVVKWLLKQMTSPIGTTNTFDASKSGFAKTSKKSGKESASDVPDWVKNVEKEAGESSKDFTKRALDTQYGPGNWEKRAIQEYSKIKKWYERH